LATLELSTERAAPGEEVSFRGWYYNDTHPVVIRWQRVDGPALATVTPDTFGMVHNHFRSMAGTLRIPPDATPGTHLLLATQEYAPPAKITWGVPARAEIQVGRGAGPGRGGNDVLPTVSGRPDSVATATTPSGGDLVAAAAAGAVTAAAVVGITVWVRRHRAAP